LLALNAEHIRHASAEKLAPHLIPFLRQQGIEAEENPFLYGIIQTLQPRAKTFVEMAEAAAFYYAAPEDYEGKGVKKFFKPELVAPMEQLISALRQIDSFDEPHLEPTFVQVMETHDLKFGKIAQPVRVALTGTTVSPGIFEMILALGREKTVARIRRACETIAV